MSNILRHIPLTRVCVAMGYYLVRVLNSKPYSWTELAFSKERKYGHEGVGYMGFRGVRA